MGRTAAETASNVSDVDTMSVVSTGTASTADDALSIGCDPHPSILIFFFFITLKPGVE